MLQVVKSVCIGILIGAFLGPIGLVIFRVYNEGVGDFFVNPFAFMFVTLIYGGFYMIIPGSILGALLGLSLGASKLPHSKKSLLK